MIWLYRLLYLVLLVVVHLAYPLLPAKLKTYVRERWTGFSILRRPLGPHPIWVHASSGEIEYAKPVLRLLREKHPELPLLLTYSSPSAKKLLEGFESFDLAVPTPWDTPWALQKFIRHFKPRCLLIARTDAWPEMIQQTKQAGITSCLFAATFAKESSRLQGLGLFFSRLALENLDHILVVNDDDVANLTRAQVRTDRVLVGGDTRFEQVLYRLQNPKPLRDELKPVTQTPILVAGSTWPEDERVLFSALQSIKQSRPIKVILCPHEVHPTHLTQIKNELKQLGLTYILYSDATHWKNADILLVDKVGILAELYSWGDVAFVGGSFKKQVHSVMEALGSGLPVLVGPYHHNNREALLFKSKNWVTEVTSASEMSTMLVKNFDLAHQKKFPRQQLLQDVKSLTGGSEKVLRQLGY